MQIRKRGQKVEFLRAVYDSIAKRTKQKLIKREDFTEAEKAQFEEYIKVKNNESHDDTLKFAARHSAISIAEIAMALERGYELPGGDSILSALDRLNAALRKRGVTRPPKSKAAPAKPA